MANLVAHRILTLCIVRIPQIVFIHLGNGRLDDTRWNCFNDYIDTQITSFSKIGRAYLLKAVFLLAGVVDIPSDRRQSEGVRVSIIPIVECNCVFTLPCIVQCIQYV